MGISQGVVLWLREQGHDAVHLREQGLQRLPDPEILKKGLDEGRVVLTVDLDFPQILAASSAALPSVILFRLADQTPASLIRRLQQFLPFCQAELLSGAVLSVTETAVRLRRLPLTKPETGS